MRRHSKGESTIVTVFVIWSLAIIGFWTVVAYVAFHFLEKVW